MSHFTASYAAAEPLAPPPPWLISRPLQDDVLDAPFSPSEIQHQLRRAKKSAPGSDKLTYGDWKWADPEAAILCTIFNICRAAGRVPSDWKRSTVTLLPKGGDGSIVRNWRPICLQNTIYKLYSASIARRIADWAISSNAILPSQKGFLPYDGCAEHSFILRSILNDSRRARRNVLIAWLDLRDAFGSVSHDLMLLMMSRLGLVGKTLTVVADIYRGSTIAIKTGKNSLTPDIPQQRGVKQGCPLSPLLFNIAMEGMLRHLATCPHGYRIGEGVNINHLAYADDVCILAGSRMQGQVLLERCTDFTAWASLCAVNNVSPTYVDPTPLHLGDDPIPALTWHQRYKYLGCPVGAGSTQDLSSIKDSLLRDTEILMTSQLAEWQKLDTYRRFLFPRLSYVLKIFFPGSSWCHRLDTGTRKWLKKAVSIPFRACSSFLYTPQALGGLGVPCIEDEMHIARVAQSVKFLGLRDMHRFSIATGGRGHHIVLGDIVLVHDEAYPRTYWRLGKVERLIKGHDEQIRAAVVPVASRSGTTTLKGPVQLLYPLELNHADHEKKESEPLRRGAEQQDVLRRLPRLGGGDQAEDQGSHSISMNQTLKLASCHEPIGGVPELNNCIFE